MWVMKGLGRKECVVWDVGGIVASRTTGRRSLGLVPSH